MSRTALEAYLDRLRTAPSEASPVWRVGPRRVAGRFYGAELTSAFQPVVARGDRVAGHVAYVRSYTTDGQAELSPWQVFSLGAEDEDLVRLDRLCRTVHAVNYFAESAPDWRLHLAVEHRLLATVPAEHGRTFEGVLRAFGIGTSRVVIELPVSVADSPALLASVLSNYRHRGYAVAVRARAVPEAVERLAPFQPDIVRLRASEVPRDGLRQLIDGVRAMGAHALVDHVESAVTRVAAESAGADLVQGLYLGAPGAAPSALTRGAAAERRGRIGWLDDSALLIGAGPLL